MAPKMFFIKSGSSKLQHLQLTMQVSVWWRVLMENEWRTLMKFLIFNHSLSHFFWETWIYLKNLLPQSFPMYFESWTVRCPKYPGCELLDEVNMTRQPPHQHPRYYATPAINTPIDFARLHLLKSPRPRNPASISQLVPGQENEF